MRRVSAILGATAVLAPLVLSSATPASAASGSLTITTLGRDGKAVATNPQVVNLSTHEPYWLTSGKAYSLPAGRYAVMVDVWNYKDNTDTLGAAIVTVAGRTKTTIDARQGRGVKVSLDHSPGAGFEQRYDVRLCLPGSAGSVDAWAEAGHLYVIPNSSSALQFAYVSSWNRPGAKGPGERYIVAGLNKRGLPKGLAAVVRRSSLANLRVQARSGPTVDTQNTVDFATTSGHDTCQYDLIDFGDPYTLPYNLTVHVSAGSWQTAERSTANYSYNAPRTFAAGASYDVLFNRSAWGPGGQLPFTWGSGRRLYVDPDAMFFDPSVTYSAAPGRTTVVLSKGGRTISRKSFTTYGNGPGTFNPVIPGAGWYSLSLTAKRYQPGVHFPAGMLSSASTLSMHFYANPAKSTQIPLYYTQFVPTQLSAANRATPGSTTSVNLRLYRPKPLDHLVGYPSDAVRSVKVWASFDGAKTWHTVKVKHSGSSWTALVPNGHSGPISLRSTVLDTHGDSATTTVYRAYLVG
ncbi:hypothetical protein [Peterkaempfera sp. SMS 1(5)a]|uniref:hypothetical protein n=1 Tax=Peterkaempfera podocarpi TaxID=3232308 RepID=UPI003670FB40